MANIRHEYDKAREAHLNKRSDKRYKTIEEARANKFQDQHAGYCTGTCIYRHKVFEDYPLEELVPYIDWTPFFHTWELRGSYPKIFNDKNVGTEAKKLFDDAQVLIEQELLDEKVANCKSGNWLLAAQAQW